MKCGEVARHVQEHLDYRLSKAEYRKLKEHLDGCPNCTAYLDSLKKTVRLYHEYPDPKIPNKIRRELHATLKLGK
jgi:hypothetical protein